MIGLGADEIRVLALRHPARVSWPRLYREFRVARPPAALGPEAILCIRRLRTPPSTVGLEAALATSLNAAVRPARETVPADADTVLFVDSAELLASLARDFCAGDLPLRWWWAAMFSRRDLAAALQAGWRQHPSAIPAALCRLENAGLAERFLARLPRVFLDELWRGIIGVFDLPYVHAAWCEPILKIEGAESPAAVILPSFAETPWSQWIQLESTLPESELRLLVTALMLERAPAVVRSLAFASAIRVWRTVSAASVTVPVSSVEALTPPSVAARVEAPPVARAGKMRAIGGRSLGPSKPRPHPGRATSFAVFDRVAEPNLRGDDFRLRTRPEERGKMQRGRAIAHSLVELAIPIAEESADQIITAYGGVFYLVNVALALGLYGDFTAPAQSGLALPLWDFLALIGARMVGTTWSEDSLAGLLARLSGRSEEEPAGQWFEPPDGERLGEWVERKVTDIQARLAAALETVDPPSVGPFVLHHCADIAATATRVGVYFSLAAHPIELRIAGLDRDPGWVPAGGRSIAFHYD
jgi:hypothetical protein